MLKKSEWVNDLRPLRPYPNMPEKTWQEWIDCHYKPREHWLMSIIDYLIKNQDWAGGYLLIRAYIATCKQKEGIKHYNQAPWDESPHIRAVRLWFFSIVEKYNFAMEEEKAPDVPYDEEDNTLARRRKLENKAAEVYPFVGGIPKRRYSESVEFFEQVASDREYIRKKPRNKSSEED
jgi:hypothetical protein